MNLHVILSDLPPIGINANEWTTGFAGIVGPWIAGSLGLAVIILAVLYGWRLLENVAAEGDEATEDQDNEEAVEAGEAE